MELSPELQSFILENGILVFKPSPIFSNWKCLVKVILDKTKHDSFINEFENILKLYDTAIFYGNYKVDVDKIFHGGIISSIHYTKYHRFYYLQFDQMKEFEEMEVLISNINFNKGA